MNWRCFFGGHDWYLPFCMEDLKKPPKGFAIPVILECSRCGKKYAAKFDWIDVRPNHPGTKCMFHSDKLTGWDGREWHNSRCPGCIIEDPYE